MPSRSGESVFSFIVMTVMMAVARNSYPEILKKSELDQTPDSDIAIFAIFFVTDDATFHDSLARASESSAFWFIFLFVSRIFAILVRNQ